MNARFLAFLLVMCAVPACADAPSGDAPTSTVDFDRTPSSSEPALSRLTLTLSDAPLLQVLHLLSQTGAAKFRFGTPPDAVVSVRWNDESPLENLDALTRGAGCRLQSEAGDFFLLPADSAAPNDVATRGKWLQWKGNKAPSRGELTGAVANAKVSLRGARIVSESTITRAASDWKPAKLSLDAARTPGISLTPDEKTGETWLRCLVPLKIVPRGTRLMLDTTENCDVLVNGAPLARNWNGIRTFDVEPLLRRGANTLVVHWRAPQGKPLLRYEWLFVGGANNGGLPGESRRDVSE